MGRRTNGAFFTCLYCLRYQKISTRKSWTAVESLHAAKAFMQASQSPVKGAGGRSVVFQTEVTTRNGILCVERTTESGTPRLTQCTGCAIVKSKKQLRKST